MSRRASVTSLCIALGLAMAFGPSAYAERLIV